MSEYAYEGEVIRINKKDFDKWQAMYPHIELQQELNQLDMLFVIRIQETGKPIKNWFSECFERLNGRNKRGGNERRAKARSYGDRRADLQDALTNYDRATDF